MLVSKVYKKEILDVSVKRGPEIDSDHYLVVTKLIFKIEIIENQKLNKTSKNWYETNKIFKLPIPETATRYRNSV